MWCDQPRIFLESTTRERPCAQRADAWRSSLYLGLEGDAADCPALPRARCLRSGRDAFNAVSARACAQALIIVEIPDVFGVLGPLKHAKQCQHSVYRLRPRRRPKKPLPWRVTG